MTIVVLSKHIPKDHQMHIVLNKNFIKICYSRMNSMGSVLSSHDKMWNIKTKQISLGSNSRNKDITNYNDHKYKTTFKQHDSNHTHDLRHAKYQHSNELTTYIWQLENNNFNHSIKSSLVPKLYDYATSLLCKLCLVKTYGITKYFEDAKLLN